SGGRAGRLPRRVRGRTRPGDRGPRWSFRTVGSGFRATGRRRIAQPLRTDRGDGDGIAPGRGRRRPRRRRDGHPAARGRPDSMDGQLTRLFTRGRDTDGPTTDSAFVVFGSPVHAGRAASGRGP